MSEEAKGIHDTGVSLDGKIICIIGPPDSGKSTLVKWLLRQPEYKNTLMFDPLFGFDESQVNVVRPPKDRPKYRRYEHGNKELNKAVDKFVIGKPREERPDYFGIDETGRMLPNQKDEGYAVGELNDYNAHYAVGVWLIAQRLAQINSDFENKATGYFVTGYEGKNDKRALADVHEKLPEALDYIKTHDQYGFCYAGSNGKLETFTRIEEKGSKKMF